MHSPKQCLLGSWKLQAQSQLSPGVVIVGGVLELLGLHVCLL